MKQQRIRKSWTRVTRPEDWKQCKVWWMDWRNVRKVWMIIWTPREMHFQDFSSSLMTNCCQFLEVTIRPACKNIWLRSVEEFLEFSSTVALGHMFFTFVTSMQGDQSLQPLWPVCRVTRVCNFCDKYAGWPLQPLWPVCRVTRVCNFCDKYAGWPEFATSVTSMRGDHCNLCDQYAGWPEFATSVISMQGDQSFQPLWQVYRVTRVSSETWIIQAWNSELR
jgi:hypothetical protein